MKKLFYYAFGIISVITGLAGIYFFVNLKFDMFAMAFFECIFSTVLFIMLEERPRKTQVQKQYDDRIKSQGLGLLIITSIAVVLALFMTSCSHKGYGCHGNQSWNKMVERNNRP